jgi:drug/metabolite transporter (DMT)-like permease
VWVKWIPLFLIGAILESIGQISFKKAAMAHREVQGAHYYLKLAGNKWALGGILAYGIEMLLWIFLLSRIPLSIAFPLAGLQQVVIIVVSFLFLNEKINYAEWLGAGLIALGLSVIVRAG